MKLKIGQIQTQIAAAEAERKRIIEAFRREVSQRCIIRLSVSFLRRPTNYHPSCLSGYHLFGCGRNAGSHRERAVQAGKEIQRTRKRDPRLGKICGGVAQAPDELTLRGLRVLGPLVVDSVVISSVSVALFPRVCNLLVVPCVCLRIECLLTISTHMCLTFRGRNG